MNTQLDKDYFDCPHCRVQRVSYKVLYFSQPEDWRVEKSDKKFYRWGISHAILQCNRTSCKRLTYLKIIVNWNKKKTGYETAPNIVEFQYPSGTRSLPEYVDENIRKYYGEAVDAFNFGLINSASVMCRKVLYELCDKQKVSGRDYKEKIKNLGLDKRITDPLLNIKNIGDETVHAKGWDKETVQKALDVLAIIIDMFYVQEQRIKEFSKHYSKTVQARKKNT